MYESTNKRGVYFSFLKKLHAADYFIIFVKDNKLIVVNKKKKQ